MGDKSNKAKTETNDQISSKCSFVNRAVLDVKSPYDNKLPDIVDNGKTFRYYIFGLDILSLCAKNYFRLELKNIF